MKKNLEQKKLLEEKEISFLPNGKAIIIHSIAGLIKKTWYKMSQYFHKPNNDVVKKLCMIS